MFPPTLLPFPLNFGKVNFILQLKCVVIPRLHKLQFLILMIDLVTTEV